MSWYFSASLSGILLEFINNLTHQENVSVNVYPVKWFWEPIQINKANTHELPLSCNLVDAHCTSKVFPHQHTQGLYGRSSSVFQLSAAKTRTFLLLGGTLYISNHQGVYYRLLIDTYTRVAYTVKAAVA